MSPFGVTMLPIPQVAAARGVVLRGDTMDILTRTDEMVQLFPERATLFCCEWGRYMIVPTGSRPFVAMPRRDDYFEHFHGLHSSRTPESCVSILREGFLRPGPQSVGGEFIYAVGYKSVPGGVEEPHNRAGLLGTFQKSIRKWDPSMLFETRMFGEHISVGSYGAWKPSMCRVNTAVHFPKHHNSQWCLHVSNSCITAVWFRCA